jgi:drug/metabolite transporter (DMT)-like permease
MFVKWASVIGLALTGLGILIGFYLPTVAARWGGPETLTQESRLQVRFAIGVVFVLLGTACQIYGAWPR